MRIVALDLVRFFAALSVVLYHYLSGTGAEVFPVLSQFTQYGYLGVPLFFIISGYVIALSANNRTAGEFCVSRLLRLYPALWACILLTVCLVVIYSSQRFSLMQVLANFTLLNEYLGYEDIDGVYWTLKVELKFYACVFLLILFGVFHRFRIWLTLWLALTVCHLLFGQPFFLGWFISPAYSSFFIAGIAFYLIQEEGRNPYNLSILGVAMVVSSFRAFEQAGGFIVDATLAERLVSVGWVWLSHGVIYLLSIGKLQLQDRAFYFTLGALTYPLYLLHNVAGKAMIEYYGASYSLQWVIPLTVLFMVMASLVIHKTIEKPLVTPLKKALLGILRRARGLTGQAARVASIPGR